MIKSDSPLIIKEGKWEILQFNSCQKTFFPIPQEMKLLTKPQFELGKL
jgi:hypothetical protein